MDTTYRIDDVYAVILNEVHKRFTPYGYTLLEGAVQVSDQLEVNYFISIRVDSSEEEAMNGSCYYTYYSPEVEDIMLYYHNTETDEEVELDTDILEGMVFDAAEEELNECLGEESDWEDTKRSICNANGWGY